MTDAVAMTLIMTGGAVIGLAPATILAYATLRSSKANSTKTEAIAAKVDTIADKADEIVVKSDVSAVKVDAIAVKSDVSAVKVDAIAVKADTSAVKVDDIAVKVDTIIKKSEEIHSLTNGHLTAMTKQLDEANARVVAVEKLMAQVNELVQTSQLASVNKGRKKN